MRRLRAIASNVASAVAHSAAAQDRVAQLAMPSLSRCGRLPQPSPCAASAQGLSHAQHALPPLRPERLWQGAYNVRQRLCSSAAASEQRCEASSLRRSAKLDALQSVFAGQQRYVSGITGRCFLHSRTSLQRLQHWQHQHRQRLAFGSRPAAAADGEANSTAEQQRESNSAQQSLASRLADASVPSTLSVDSSLDVSIDNSQDGSGAGGGHDSHDGSLANGTSAQPADSLARRRNSLQRQLSAAVQQGHSDNKESGSHTLGSRISQVSGIGVTSHVTPHVTPRVPVVHSMTHCTAEVSVLQYLRQSVSCVVSADGNGLSVLQQTLRGAFQTYYTVVFYNTVVSHVPMCAALRALTLHRHTSISSSLRPAAIPVSAERCFDNCYMLPMPDSATEGHRGGHTRIMGCASAGGSLCSPGR